MARRGAPLLAPGPVADVDVQAGPRPNGGRVVDARDAVGLLRDLGLVSARDVVVDGLEVHDLSRRHRNLRVTLGDGRGYLVKQAIDDDRARTLAHEVRVLRLFADGPQPLHWDPATATLVVDLEPESTSLAAYYRRRRRFPLGLASALARALAATHAHADAHAEAALATVRGLPLVFSFDHPDVSLYYGASSASLELLGIVGATPGFAARIADARRAWRPSCVIHADARLDNAVVTPGARARDGKRLRLVDWEMAMWGDPAWDVATVVSEYLSLWLDFSPLSALTPPEEYLRHGIFHLETLQPSIRAFWRCYATGVAGSPDPARPGAGPALGDARELWDRAMGFVALRLVQTAYEATQYASTLAGPVVLKLQLARNVLEDPLAAGMALAGVMPDVGVSPPAPPVAEAHR